MRDYEIVRGFIESPRFHRRWFELGFSEKDLLELQLETDLFGGKHE